MNKFYHIVKTSGIYILVIAIFLIAPLLGNRAVTAYSDSLDSQKCVVIDAGHGGIDCGAVSCTGAYESHINLQLTIKLRDLMHLFGIQTVMIRDTDQSVYTEGNTIAAQKISDIKERVRIVNTTPNAILVSIHQNNFQDPKYFGSQVFYNLEPESKVLAEKLQIALRENLAPNNNRQTKNASGVYLMEHINCPGVLIECGFLSNHHEEAKLRDNAYQQKLCSVIAATLHQYLNT